MSGHLGHERAEIQEIHRRLAQETAEKEAVKLELYNLKQTVEMYRRKMVVLCDDPSNAGRLKELVRGFHSELKDKLHVDGAGTEMLQVHGAGGTSRTYDVLRKSLQEAQRRCDTLNSDMLRQAEANEELMQTLNTVKDSNRRLLEQIRQQTEEIQKLTQEKILDEEEAENTRWRHQAEVEKLKQDHLREHLTLKEHADERFEQSQAYYQDKLRHLQSRIEICKADLGSVKQSQFEQRQELKMAGEAMYQQVRAGEKDIMAAWESATKRHAQEKATLLDTIHDEGVKYATLREVSQQEKHHLTFQNTTLQAEKEEMTARTTRDIGQLTSQIQDLDRTLGAERQAWATERSRLEQQIEDLVRQGQNTDAMLEAAHRENIRFESSLAQSESEGLQKDSCIQDMRRQIRESDDALGCAVRGNEHLREQMEEQMQRYQEMNTKDLANAQAQYEEKIRSEKNKKDNEIMALQRHLRQVEESLSNKAAEMERAKQSTEALEMERASAARDLEMWKKQYTHATEMRQELEKEMAESRQEWGKERLRLQESIDDTQQARALVENDLQASTEAYTEYKRQAQQWEADATTRIYVLEDTNAELRRQLEQSMQSLTEQHEALAKLKAEYTSSSTKQAERISRIEDDLAHSVQEKKDLEQRLQHTIETERRELQESKDQYERWRDAHAYSLKQVQNEALQRVEDMQRERNAADERYRAELAEERRAVEMSKRTSSSLDQEVAGLRKQAQKAQQDLQLTKAQYDKVQRELEQVRHASQMEVKQLSAQVSELRNTESRLTSDLKDSQRQCQAERDRNLKALEDAKTQNVAQAIDMDAKLRGMKQEFESTLSLTESRYKDAASKDKSHVQSVIAENEKLRNIIGSQEAGGVQVLTSALESHVSRFQSKVDAIRQDLGTSRGFGDRSVLSGTPRSGSPSRPLATSPHRDLLGAGYPSTGTLSRGAFTPGAPGYSPARYSSGAGAMGARFGSAGR